MNLLIIPDAHAAPDYDNERFTAAGQFVMDERPEYVVCLGDWADLPSLSSYDKGTRGFEGRRYQKDVASAVDAQEKFFAPIKKFNEQKRKNKEKQYKPKLIMCLGNHEDRITRATQSAPELHGAIGIEDLQYKKYGWKTVAFKSYITLFGITFSHYFTSGIAGRPISSLHLGHTLVSKLHCSAVQGHTHLYNHAEHTRPDGQKIFGLSAGCLSHPDYAESWCRDTQHQWWRGLIVLRELDGEGYYDEIRAITLRKLIRDYL